MPVAATASCDQISMSNGFRPEGAAGFLVRWGEQWPFETESSRQKIQGPTVLATLWGPFWGLAWRPIGEKSVGATGFEPAT